MLRLISGLKHLINSFQAAASLTRPQIENRPSPTARRENATDFVLVCIRSARRDSCCHRRIRENAPPLVYFVSLLWDRDSDLQLLYAGQCTSRPNRHTDSGRWARREEPVQGTCYRQESQPDRARRCRSRRNEPDLQKRERVRFGDSRPARLNDHNDQQRRRTPIVVKAADGKDDRREMPPMRSGR
jgi:hypothetical protein